MTSVLTAHRVVYAAIVLCLSLVAVDRVHGQASDPRAADRTAVQTMMREVDRLFNEGDSHALSLLYAEDGDRRDAVGGHAKGRRQVEEMYESAFRARSIRKNAPDNQTRIAGDTRFLSADVAIIDGFLTAPDKRRAPFTIVATKVNGRWMVAAGRVGAVIQ